MRLVGSLKFLLLSQNKLTSTDGDSFALLTNLEELTLECNQLSHLPFSLGALTKLTLLWAGQNRITGVPTSLGRLANLRSLRLEQNLISFVPVELGRLERVEDMNLFNNPGLYQPPPDVVVRGCKHVLAYLQRLLLHKGLTGLDANREDVYIFDDELDAPGPEDEAAPDHAAASPAAAAPAAAAAQAPVKIDANGVLPIPRSLN